MKIIHSADWHLDTPFTGHSGEALATLRQAQMELPGKVAALCKAEGCSLLLLSGDLFDGAHSADSLRAVMQALEEAAVPVFISPGNHDFCRPDSPYLTAIWPKNVHIFTKPTIESIPLPALDCRVYGAGYQSMDCGPLLENFCISGQEACHIAVLHGDPTQLNSPYCPITQTQAAASGLTYLALGHVHKAGSFTAGDTLCGWPGCPMGRGNDESGEKGVYLVDTDARTLRFIPLDTPRFYDLEAEVTATPEEAVLSALPAVGNHHFYRITLTGECPPFDAPCLPQFPNLTIRDRTTPPADLWGCIQEDTLEGNFFRMLHEAMENDEETATLAAKISRKILDGQEVALP